MKSLLALALLSTLFTSNAFAAHACIISSDNSVFLKDSYYAQIYISCDGANKDARTITLKKPDTAVSDANIATVIAELVAKGYKLVSQTNERYTMINDAL